MLGVVYRGRKDVRVERVPKPRIETSNDALVRVTAAGICGSDLHLYHYSVPEPIGGTIVLGREQVLLTP